MDKYKAKEKESCKIFPYISYHQKKDENVLCTRYYCLAKE